MKRFIVDLCKLLNQHKGYFLKALSNNLDSLFKLTENLFSIGDFNLTCHNISLHKFANCYDLPILMKEQT